MPLEADVEWDMRTVLPEGLALLRQKGWDSSKQPLIGMPQAFGYNPRTARGNGQILPQPTYRPPPTQTQLATQVSAFCKYGAQSIIGYVWNDNSVGKITELFNSEALRTGMQKGGATCRSAYWPGHP